MQRGNINSLYLFKTMAVYISGFVLIIAVAFYNSDYD